MATDNLVTDLEHILAAKRQYLAERRAKTPIAAVIALADMQSRPKPILNTVTNGAYVTLIGQITHSETYDPVAATLGFIREGVDAVALFTDQTIYRRSLDDLLLVSRGVNIPVVAQDYILDEYHVVEARAAGASALVLSAAVLDQATLRKVVSATQRWRMTAIVQVATEEQLLMAQALSPHVIGVGELVGDAQEAIDLLQELRPKITYNVRCMVITAMQTVEQVAALVEMGVDAVVASESLLTSRTELARLKGALGREK
jgi:indole-3-glycerol phosphate synthase